MKSCATKPRGDISKHFDVNTAICNDDHINKATPQHTSHDMNTELKVQSAFS